MFDLDEWRSPYSVLSWVQKEAWVRAVPYTLTEVQRMLVDSALSRGDYETARQFVRDWAPNKPCDYVQKFVPGDHYYALGVRYDTEREARCALSRAGYECLGLRRVHTRPRSGD